MKRDYGIDLLKMVAMMMVVAHHILQGGDVERKLLESGRGAAYFEQVFHCFCYCAVDCFVMATGYIMCRHTFKYVRIFRLWRQFVGYSLFFVALGCMLLPAGIVGWRHWIEAVMPVTTNANWFLTEYFALFFTIPFLNKMLNALSGREKRILLLSGFLLFSVMSSLSGKDLFAMKWGYSYVWFMYLYVLGASLVDLRQTGFLFRLSHSSPPLVFAVAAGSVLSAACFGVGQMLSARYGCGGRIEELAYSYASPTLLLEAIALFLLFARIEVVRPSLRRLIAFLAPSTFIVFVVHTDGMFQRLVGWRHVFLWMGDCGALVAVVGTVFTSILVYALIVGVDVARRISIEWMMRLLNGSD